MRLSVVAAIVIPGIVHGAALAQPSIAQTGAALPSQYRWIDAAGVVHYSNFPPSPNTALAPLPSPPPPAKTVAAPRPSPAPAPAPSLAPSPANAVIATSLAPSIRIVKASGEYQMGDRDTREEATRLATEAARKNALEQVATYLERVTVVADAKVSRDEIKTYTAGVILVLDQKTSTRLDGDAIVVHVDLTAQVDPDEVVQAIKALRQNDQAAAQIAALRVEVDRLQGEVDAANRSLASAATRDQAVAISRERQDLLNRIASNAALAQAWTDWVIVTPVVVGGAPVAFGQVQGLVAQARSLSPNNPYLVNAQRVIVNQPPPPPPPRYLSPPVYVTQAPTARTSPPVVYRVPAPAHGYPPPAYTPAAPKVVYATPVGQLPPTLYQLHPAQQQFVPRVPYRAPVAQATPPSSNQQSWGPQSPPSHPSRPARSGP